MENPPTVSRQTIPPSSSTGALHCCTPVQIGKTAENTSKLPNLTVFVGEVALQQRQQREALEDLQEILAQLQEQVAKEKTNYQSLSMERLLWEQKIVLNKELAVQNRAEIAETKDEVMKMMKQRLKLDQENLDIEHGIKFQETKIRDQIEKMEKHRKKIEELEAKSVLCRKISDAKEKLVLVEDKIRDCKKTKSVSLKFDEIGKDISRFDKEKRRLEGILSHKRKQVQDESEKIGRKLKEQAAARNKLTAQKLRLRRQIERAKLASQQLRYKANSVRKQIREFTG